MTVDIFSEWAKQFGILGTILLLMVFLIGLLVKDLIEKGLSVVKRKNGDDNNQNRRSEDTIKEKINKNLQETGLKLQELAINQRGMTELLECIEEEGSRRFQTFESGHKEKHTGIEKRLKDHSEKLKDAHKTIGCATKELAVLKAKHDEIHSGGPV